MNGEDTTYHVNVAWGSGRWNCACECHHASFWGFPCKHIVRVCARFRDYTTGRDDVRALCFTDYIPLLPMFDSYWHRDSEEWIKRVPAEWARRGCGNGELFGADEDGTLREGLLRGHEKAVSYQNSKNPFDLIHTKVESMPHSVKLHFLRLYERINEMLDDDRVPQLMRASLAPTEVGRLQNPNAGRAAYRDSRVRKRGKNEKMGKKPTADEMKKKRTN